MNKRMPARLVRDKSLRPPPQHTVRTPSITGEDSKSVSQSSVLHLPFR